MRWCSVSCFLVALITSTILRKGVPKSTNCECCIKIGMSFMSGMISQRWWRGWQSASIESFFCLTHTSLTYQMSSGVQYMQCEVTMRRSGLCWTRPTWLITSSSWGSTEHLCGHLAKSSTRLKYVTAAAVLVYCYKWMLVAILLHTRSYFSFLTHYFKVIKVRKLATAWLSIERLTGDITCLQFVWKNKFIME